MQTASSARRYLLPLPLGEGGGEGNCHDFSDTGHLRKVMVVIGCQSGCGPLFLWDKSGYAVTSRGRVCSNGDIALHAGGCLVWNVSVMFALCSVGQEKEGFAS